VFPRTISVVWQTPSTFPTLAAEEVHIWRFDLDRQVDELVRLEAWLSPQERERADRFLGPRLRNHFIAGRGIMRAVLAAHLGLEPVTVQFRYGPRGKPQLDLQQPVPPLQFNLAHSGGRALLGIVSGYEIGVDVEQIRTIPEIHRIVNQFFSAAEIVEFFALPEGLRTLAFFNGWTRKEAYLKATGGGLANALDSFDVTLSSGVPPRLLRDAGDPGAPTNWTLYHLDPGPGYLGALAVQGAGHRLRYLELSDKTLALV
jgi:4'-phosphopantetheinyl transferase